MLCPVFLCTFHLVIAVSRARVTSRVGKAILDTRKPVKFPKGGASASNLSDTVKPCFALEFQGFSVRKRPENGVFGRFWGFSCVQWVAKMGHSTLSTSIRDHSSERHTAQKGSKMKRLLTVEEVLDTLRISRPTLARWVQLARQGKTDFPLPVQTGAKTKRLWHPSAIEQWSECRKSTPVTTITTRPSPSKTTKLIQERRAHTEAVLAGHGIALNSTKKEV